MHVIVKTDVCELFVNMRNALVNMQVVHKSVHFKKSVDISLVIKGCLSIKVVYIK